MHPLSTRIKTEFLKLRNESQAAGMAAYMKKLFPFLGIKTPVRRALIRKLNAEAHLASFSELKVVLEELWSLDEREFQYAAMDLLQLHKKKWNDKLHDLVESLITRKSWWDTVDCLASSVYGAFLLKNRIFPEDQLDRWLESPDMWLNRSAIIFQLSHKDKTNPVFLEKAIARHIASPEFFIQKAIGWALRQYARTHPEFVIKITGKYPLKPLSRREALKRL
jgi:3-methyladenine DNA glycosylase AlkD